MCVAIPGLVKKLKDGKVTIDVGGNEVEAYAGLVNVKEGDYALVHAGCVIQTLKKSLFFIKMRKSLCTPT